MREKVDEKMNLKSYSEKCCNISRLSTTFCFIIIDYFGFQTFTTCVIKSLKTLCK